MDKLTFEEAFDKLLSGRFIKARSCCLCGAANGFVLHRDMQQICYDTNCDCVNYRTTPHVVDLQTFVDFIKNQSKE
jgi:hypothetical protein